ncbi:MAG: YHS domain-containing (seleno)protein [Pseudomonadota bacterium]
MKLRTFIAAAALVTAPAVFTSTAIADDAVAPVFTAEDNNLAVGGYDSVSYFSGAPVEGSADFTTTYEGAEFRFASQENLDTFLAEPAKYAPAYGGYCAWGASQGGAYPGDPQVYAVVDGRLYLNYNAEVQETWNEDRAGFIATADEKWPTVLNPEPAAAQGS